MSQSTFPYDLIDDPATFETMTGPKVKVPVHFNPASLQHTVSNTLKEEGKGAKKKQYVSQTTAKLTMDLVFDTTDSGEDVRITTNKMAQLLKPVAAGKSKNVPPVVKFSWGAYSFTGMVEQYKETIDFFAAGGLPLRSSINLTLSSQDAVFESGTSDHKAPVDGDLSPEPVVLPHEKGPFGGPQGAADKAGDPRAARGIAAINGSASLRFGAGAGLAVGASASVGFSAGASVGAGFSTGIGATAGGGSSASTAGGRANLLPAAAFAAGGGAGAAASLRAGAGVAAPLGGGAGLSASEGFSSLRVESPLSSRPLSASDLLQGSASISSSGKVALGGRLIDAGGSGLKANVAGEPEFVIGAR